MVASSGSNSGIEYWLDSNVTVRDRSGNDRVHGDGVDDVMTYAGSLGGYVIGSAGGALTIQDVDTTNGSEGTDSLFDVSKVAFDNVTLTVTRDTLIPIASFAFPASATTTVLTDGSFVVSWSEPWNGVSADTGGHYRARHFTASGHALPDDVSLGLNGANFAWSQPVIALSGSDYILTWTAPATSGANGSANVNALRHDASGASHGVFGISDTSADDQAAPAVATLADGSAVVAWTALGQEPGAHTAAIYARHLDAAGNALGAEFRVNTHTDGDQYAAAVAPLANGGYVVIWGQGLAPPNDAGAGPSLRNMFLDINLGGISLQRFDAHDQKVGDEVLVSSLPGALPQQVLVDPDSGMPNLIGVGAVTALHGGGFIVAFSYRLPYAPERSNITLVHFDDDGNVVGSPNAQLDDFPNPATTPASGTFLLGGANVYPALAGLADGGYVVIWYTHDNLRFPGIWGQRFDATDHRVGDTFLVASRDLVDFEGFSDVTALADGGYLVTWTAGHLVHVEHYDADAHAVDVALTVTGTAGADVLNVGDAQFLTIDGAGGDDRLNGGSGDDTLLGGAGIDRLAGGAGNDWLDGGPGADRMRGGSGDDTYVIDNVQDVVLENGGDGVDTVIASFSYTLGVTLERLTLTGTANLAATGNALDNVIVGNAGNNLLTGAAGADTLAGGTGNDTYVVDNAHDRVVETDNGGTDVVRTWVSHTLADNVEHLTLLGSAAIDGTGNGLANRLGGNDGNNVLGGGDGDDVLNGGRGRDRLHGDDGSDRLAGGPGADTLSGGNGRDVFVFNQPAGLGDADVVLDFATGIDSIELSLAYFGAAAHRGTGVLAANDFIVVHGNVSTFDTHHVIYAASTGGLYYNADGRGALPAMLVATFDGHPGVTAADIHLV